MDQLASLQKALQEHGLSAVAISKACVLCGTLRRFEVEEKPIMKTVAQRARNLQSIANRLRELRTDLDGLDSTEWFSLDNALFFGGPGPEVVPPALGMETEPIGARSVYMQRMLCSFAVAAEQASISVANGKPLHELRGRKTTLPSYSGFIARLAVILKEEGIRAGRGGKFEQISNFIFTSAGVHSKADGAIRHYLSTMYYDHKSLGYVL